MNKNRELSVRLAPWVRIPVGVAVVCGVMAFARPADGQIINTLRGFEKDDGWAGRVEALLAAADGSTDYFEFDLGAAVQYRTGRNRFRLLAMRIRRESQGVKIADNTLGHLRHNYDLTGWLATVLFVQGQQNPFRRIEQRVLAGAGLRVDVVEREQFDMLAGVAYMHEREEISGAPELGVVDRDRLSIFASVLGKPRETVKMDLSVFYQPVIDDPENERSFVAATARVDIIGGLYFTFAYTLLHDQEPPPGVPKTDQHVRSGLGFEF